MIKKLVEEHKFFRRFALIWSICIITYATIRVFEHLGSLTVSDAACYATVAGVLSVVIGLYTHARSIEQTKSE